MIRGLAWWIAAACIGSPALGAATLAQPRQQPITESLKLRLVERSNTTIAEAAGRDNRAGPNASSGDACVPSPEGATSCGILGAAFANSMLAGALVSRPNSAGPVGLLASSPDAQMSTLPTLWITGLQPQDRTLCIEIRSADGQEYADGSAILPTGQAYARRIRLDYDPPPRRMADRIQGSAKSSPWRSNEFVVRARVSRNSGCAKALTYLPVSLSQNLPASPAITLLVNGGGPTATLEAGLDKAPRLDACRRMGTADSSLVRGYVTYTHSCRIAVPADLCGNDLEVRIDRETGSGRMRGAPFFVRAPCAP